MIKDLICFGPSSSKFACRRCQEIINAERKSTRVHERNCVYQYQTEDGYKTRIMGRLIEVANIKRSIPDLTIDLWQRYPQTRPARAVYGSCREHLWVLYESDRLQTSKLESFSHDGITVTKCLLLDEGFFPTIDSEFIGMSDLF